MTRKFCDICKREVKTYNETWIFDLKADKSNNRVSYDEHINDICESCATIIHGCVSLMKLGSMPDFKNIVSLVKSTEDNNGEE